MRSRVLVSLLVLSMAGGAVGCGSSVVTVSFDKSETSVEHSEDQTLKLVLSDRRPADNTNWDWFVVEPRVLELISVDLETVAENESVSPETGPSCSIPLKRVPPIS